jgi:hypothetical protein
MQLRKIAIVLGIVLLTHASCTSGIRPSSQNAQTGTPTLVNQTQGTSDYIRAIKLREWVMPRIGNMLWSADGSKFVVAFPYSPNNTHLATYDVTTGKLLWDDSQHVSIPQVSTVVFSSDERYIYTGLSYPTGVQQRDAINGQLLVQGPEDFNSENCLVRDAIGVALSKDGLTLFFLVENNFDKRVSYSEIQIWDTPTLQCRGTLIRVEGHSRSLKISPDGELLAIGISEGISSYRADSDTDKGHTIIWDITNNALKCAITGAPAIFVPQSSNLIVFESREDVDDKWINRLALWDAQNCQFMHEISRVTPPYYYLSPLSATSDGRFLAVGQRDIKILDLTNGEIVAEIKDPSPQASNLEHVNDILSFSPDGKLLFLSTPKNIGESLVTLWKIEKDK